MFDHFHLLHRPAAHGIGRAGKFEKHKRFPGVLDFAHGHAPRWRAGEAAELPAEVPAALAANPDRVAWLCASSRLHPE